MELSELAQTEAGQLAAVWCVACALAMLAMLALNLRAPRTRALQPIRRRSFTTNRFVMVDIFDRDGALVAQVRAFPGETMPDVIAVAVGSRADLTAYDDAGAIADEHTEYANGFAWSPCTL